MSTVCLHGDTIMVNLQIYGDILSLVEFLLRFRPMI